MVYKIGLAVAGISAFAFGATYLFNHVNPWVAQIVTFIGIVVFIGAMVSIIKQLKKDK